MENKELTLQLQRLQNELDAKVEYIHELVQIKDEYKEIISELKQKINNLQQLVNLYDEERQHRDCVVISGYNSAEKREWVSSMATKIKYKIDDVYGPGALIPSAWIKNMLDSIIEKGVVL